jgi:hypothetical protein
MPGFGIGPDKPDFVSTRGNRRFYRQHDDLRKTAGRAMGILVFFSG